MRLSTFAFAALFVACSSKFSYSQAMHRKPPAKPGVAKPGVQIPLSRLKPRAIFPVPGSPDWIAVGDATWISNKPRNSVSELDPATNTVSRTITGFNKPCSGLAIGFGSLWVPNCGNQTLSRVDLSSGKPQATIPAGVADSEGGIAIGAGSVWMMTSANSTLSRLDPEKNKWISTLRLPEGCYTPAFGFDSVWITCTHGNSVVRVDPKTNRVVAQIPVDSEPRFLTVGLGSVWTLAQGDGKVVRIDPVSNKVSAVIDVGIPGPGGDISAGEGSIWATSFGFPVSRIDPATNTVVQQFVGNGGDALRAANGSVWLSNYQSGTVWRIDPKTLAAIKPN